MEPLPAEAWELFAVVTGMLEETYERTAPYYAARMARTGTLAGWLIYYSCYGSAR